MSISMIISQIENQIKNLPPNHQIKMLERVVRNLQQVLVARHDITNMPKAERKGMTEQINRIYSVEASQLDRQFIDAQFTSIDQDEWR